MFNVTVAVFVSKFSLLLLWEMLVRKYNQELYKINAKNI